MAGNRKKRASASAAEQGSNRRRRSASESPFDSLDDPLLSRIFSFLGYYGAYISSGARLVCRRWRDVLSQIEWQEIDVWAFDERGDINRALRGVSRGIELLNAGRLVSLSGITSFSISLANIAGDDDEEDELEDEEKEDGGTEEEKEDKRALRRTHRTLLALKICNRFLTFLERAAKKGWPLERFTLITTCQTWPSDAALSKLGIQIDARSRGDGEDDGRYVQQVLRALAAGGQSQLKHLEIESSTVIPNLRAVLASFPQLQTLHLGCMLQLEGPGAPLASFCLDEQAAAAIAELLPHLRSLSAGFGLGNEAILRLASLEHLEELEIIELAAGDRDTPASMAFELLAASPAGRSLKRLVVLGRENRTRIGACTLLAVTRFRALEKLAFMMNNKDVEGDYEAAEKGMRALGAMPELRVLSINLHRLHLHPGLFTALADSVRRAPKLNELSLHINGPIQSRDPRAHDPAAFPTAVSSLLAAAASRPGVLRTWSIQKLCPPLALSLEDAKLLASCARTFSNLHIPHPASSPADLEPVRFLHARYAVARVNSPWPYSWPLRYAWVDLRVSEAALPGLYPALAELLAVPSTLLIHVYVGKRMFVTDTGTEELAELARKLASAAAVP